MAAKIDKFNQQGFLKIDNFLSASQRHCLHDIVSAFHARWLSQNQEAYLHGAVNSAYLTQPECLNTSHRQLLFQFLASHHLMRTVKTFFVETPGFMNTQLFFDPANPAQSNYWHRDGQYQQSPDEYKAQIGKLTVLHFRLALVDEPGIELIPGTHQRWDTEQELAVRMARGDSAVSDPLPQSRHIALNAGDLLIFDANMLHRGIYGQQRKALDVLFCDPVPELLRFADISCLPDPGISLEDASAFNVTRTALSNNS